MSDTPTPTPPARPPLPRQRLPRLSGKASAAWLVLCFALTAVLIPMALHLPRWVEYEIVLAAWWAIWLGVLARLLYARQRVSDDHALAEPRSWLPLDRGDGKKSQGSGWSWPGGGWWWWGGPVEVDGCAYFVLFLLALVVLFFLAWFVVEVAAPLLLFLLYFVTRGMLAAVVNDRHHCQGRLGRSLGRAALWATAYTAPLALAVWAVHYLHGSAPAGG